MWSYKALLPSYLAGFSLFSSTPASAPEPEPEIETEPVPDPVPEPEPEPAPAPTRCTPFTLSPNTATDSASATSSAKSPAAAPLALPAPEPVPFLLLPLHSPPKSPHPRLSLPSNVESESPSCSSSYSSPYPYLDFDSGSDSEFDLDATPCPKRVTRVPFNTLSLRAALALAPSFSPTHNFKEEQDQALFPPAMDIATPSFSSPANSTLSSPLSNLSKTPSLPSSPDMPDPTNRYPSPTSTTTSGIQSPIKLYDPVYSEEEIQRKLDAAAELSRPAKRRRITPPKERTTEYLDLTKPDSEVTKEDSQQIERLLTALRKKKKIVVIAGAGISVSAGIPDFRSPTGMFATVKRDHKLKGSGKHLFDASVYQNDSSTESFHAMVRQMAEMSKAAKPTPFHHLLASLAQEGRLLRLYSQNIDGIDTSMKPLETNIPLNAKGPWPTTIQLHGSLDKMVCSKCGHVEAFKGDLFDGPEAPLCKTCEIDDAVRTAHAGKRSRGIGKMRPRVVLYHEHNPDQDAIGSVSSADLKARPDAVIVVGTTLKVPGTRRLVKELCQVTRDKRNGLTVWINLEGEPKGAEFKDCWDLVVRSKCDNIARLAALPPWDCSIGDDYLVSQEEERESLERRSKTTFAVNLPSNPSHPDIESHFAGKPKQVEKMQGIPTPTASPKISATKKGGRTKQSKITFDGKQSDVSKPAKATKVVSKPRALKPQQSGVSKPAKTKKKASRPRVLKPTQSSKAQPPRQTITQNFKSTKAYQLIAKKVDGDLASQPPTDSTSFPALRPERRRSDENFLFTRESSEGNTERSSSGPPTPTMPARRKQSDTISPTSCPIGFSHLIE